MNDRYGGYDKNIERGSLAREIREKGNVLWHVSGFSMWPLIDPKKDIVLIKKLEGEASPMDVVMYEDGGRQDGAPRNLLHRVLEVRNDVYMILGDNCEMIEMVPKENIIGIMGDLLKSGKPYDFGSLAYSNYLRLWIRPWRMRVKIIRSRRRIASVCRRIVRSFWSKHEEI